MSAWSPDQGRPGQARATDSPGRKGLQGRRRRARREHGQTCARATPAAGGGERRPRSLHAPSTACGMTSAGETDTRREAEHRPEQQSPRTRGRRAAPQARACGSTQHARCWDGWRSPATRPAAREGPGRLVEAAVRAWRVGSGTRARLELAPESAERLTRGHGRAGAQGQDCEPEATGRAHTPRERVPPAALGLSGPGGPCHQALTGPCARPAGSPWRAQESWPPCSSDPQSKGRSLGTITRLGVDPWGPSARLGVKAQGVLPTHLGAGGHRDAPPQASVLSWVPTSCIGLCGEWPPCFQGGPEVPSTLSWPCGGECGNRPQSRAITVPGLSTEPLGKCAHASTFKSFTSLGAPWAGGGYLLGPGAQRGCPQGWPAGAHLSRVGTRFLSPPQGRVAPLKSAGCCRPAVPAGSTRNPMTNPAGRETGGRECGRGHLGGGRAGRAAGGRAAGGRAAATHKVSPCRAAAAPTTADREAPSRALHTPTPHPGLRSSHLPWDRTLGSQVPDKEVPLTFLLETRCSPGTTKGRMAQA